MATKQKSSINTFTPKGKVKLRRHKKTKNKHETYKKNRGQGRS